MRELSQSIEAILFATSEPQTFSSLSQRFGVTVDEVKDALTELQGNLEGHGIALTLSDSEVTFVTRPNQAILIESIRKEELSKELSKASAETLAIVAYYPGATKAQIEYVRGVNASFSLRSLQIRGLVEQKGSGRSVTYHPTLEMLRHFGVTRMEELPQYEETNKNIIKLLERESEEGKE